MTMTLTSAAFSHEAAIPSRHTCEGLDVSPPLRWAGVPSEARSLALIVEDPDAPDPKNPKTTWAHWVLYDLPARDGELPGEVTRLPEGTREGLNDWKRTGWGGPCPPIGTHRYFFVLHAVDRELGDLSCPTRRELLEALDGHVLAKAVLMGTYRKHLR